MRGIYRVAFWATLSASVLSFVLALGNPRPVHAILWPWIIIPVWIAAMPIRDPRRLALAGWLLVLYIFFPFSMSIGLFYVPGALLLQLSSLIKALTRPASNSQLFS